MKEFKEIKEDLRDSKWLEFNDNNIEKNPLFIELSKVLKKSEILLSVVDGYILREDKQLAKDTKKLAKLQDKEIENKSIDEKEEKIINDISKQINNPKKPGKGLIAITDRRTITVYEDLNKEYKIKAKSRGIEKIVEMTESQEPGLNVTNFLVNFGKETVEIVTSNETDIKHFEFTVDGLNNLEAERAMKKYDEKPEAKKVPVKKAESKATPAKKEQIAHAAKNSKPVEKKEVAKKDTTKAVKKAASKPEAKRTAAKKPTAKKPAAKKPVAKKAATTKPAAKKTVAKKAPAKKAAKPVAKKPVEQKPVEAKKAQPVKKSKPAKKAAPKKAAKPAAKKPVENKKPAKSAKANKASKLVSKKFFGNGWLFKLIAAIMTIGMIVTSAIMYSTNWLDEFWIPAAACQLAFAVIAIVALSFVLVPMFKAKNFGGEFTIKWIEIVAFLFIFLIAAISTGQIAYEAMKIFEYIITVISALALVALTVEVTLETVKTLK